MSRWPLHCPACWHFSLSACSLHSILYTKPRFYYICTVVIIILFLVVVILYYVGRIQEISSWLHSTEMLPNQQLLHYGVVIDAGSSGSRVFVYTWPPHTGNLQQLLQIQQLRDESNNPVVKKITPGLSSFADRPYISTKYLLPLLQYAAEYVPENKHKETPLYILATAGMRMIPEKDKEAILENLRKEIPKNFSFHFSDTQVEVISGKQEGVYSWIAINHMLGRFDHKLGDHDVPLEVDPTNHILRRKTVGIMDMGGGSLQIAFEVPNFIHFAKVQTEQTKNLMAEFNLGCMEHDLEHSYRVYVATFLGYGGNVVHDRYNELLIKQRPGNSSLYNSQIAIKDPCLPVNLEDEVTVEAAKFHLKGTGDYKTCQMKLQPLLNLSETCGTDPCVMNGVPIPPIHFLTVEFYGFSEFWYSTEDVLRLGGVYDFTTFEKAAKDYCATKWSVLEDRYKKNLYPLADWHRFKNQCFKSAWMAVVLHDGLKFPKSYKNFRSVNSVRGMTAHWSLGALLYRTRFFPLRSVQQDNGSQVSSRIVPAFYLNYYLMLLCIGVVITAIFLYLRRLRRISRVPAHTIQHTTCYMSEPSKSIHLDMNNVF